MKNLLIISFLISSAVMLSQELDADLIQVKEKLENIKAYRAEVELEEDIDFIHMPKKTAVLKYKKDEPLEIESDEFVLIPKRGLDLSFSSLFMYDFITLNRGEEELNGDMYKLVSIIPNDKKADFSLANLYLDTVRQRITAAEINTKEEGTFFLKLSYSDDQDILPEMIEVTFSLARMKIPFNFMGKDSTIDRKAMRQEEIKEGRIILRVTSFTMD